jgi:hypothetical protein
VEFQKHGDMEVETWRHGDGDMEIWRHRYRDMKTWINETWKHGHGILMFSVKNLTKDRKWNPKQFSLICLPFVHCTNGSSSYCLFVVSFFASGLNGLNRLNELNGLNRLNELNGLSHLWSYALLPPIYALSVAAQIRVNAHHQGLLF